MGKITKSLWRISLVILLSVLFVVTMVVISFPMFALVEQRFKKEVTGETPRLFPILVITSTKVDNSLEAHIIYKKDLDDFLKYYHEYSFLVPVGQAEKLNEELLRRSYGVTSVSHYPWLMRFKLPLWLMAGSCLKSNTNKTMTMLMSAGTRLTAKR